MKKQIMSIVASAALLTTGAMAFDMESNGNMVADITAATLIYTTYQGGENATTDLNISSNLQGNALIYPAFKSDDNWSTEISVRNTKDVAIVAKAVLYAQDNSRELLDFNLYLSPHDAAKFTIANNKVTSTDGSIAYQVTDPRYGVTKDDIRFASESTPFSADFSSNAPAGYVVIYAMMEQASGTALTYHQKHKEIFLDYRKTLDICRENDEDNTTAANWRKTFNLSPLNTHVNNGSAINATDTFLAPNQTNVCSSTETNFAGNWEREATFSSPSEDALFGEVSIAHTGDKRSLLLPATALSNYVENNKVMLWAEGEYASIQDRRIDSNGDYVPADIKKDAETFIVNKTYFTFNKKTESANDTATLLLTQPMKRALQMANEGNSYWANKDISSNKWGEFKISRTPWTDDEGTLAPAAVVDPEAPFGSLNSPLDGAAPATTPIEGGYTSELTALTYSTLTEGFDSVFSNGEAGYIDISIVDVANNLDGLPAIISEMTSTDVGGEAQINWIYSVAN